MLLYLMNVVRLEHDKCCIRIFVVKLVVCSYAIAVVQTKPISQQYSKLRITRMPLDHNLHKCL